MAKADLTDLIKFLEAFPAESREIALWLREWVWDLYPTCNEMIYDNYNFLAFGWAPTDKMSDVFCSIAVGTRGVSFGFMWGVKLDDPKGLLQGGGNQFRSLRVPEKEKFPKTDVKKLIKQAYGFSLSKLDGRPQMPVGQTIVKSISAKQRRPGMAKKTAAPRRERHPMPEDILRVLETTDLIEAYNSRPPYQQNDYVGWIAEAKQPATRQRRLDAMLDELRQGDRYMRAPYRPTQKGKK